MRSGGDHELNSSDLITDQNYLKIDCIIGRKEYNARCLGWRHAFLCDLNNGIIYINTSILCSDASTDFPKLYKRHIRSDENYELAALEISIADYVPALPTDHTCFSYTT